MNSLLPLTAVSSPDGLSYGKLSGAQEVAAAELGGVHAQLVGEQVHRALDDVGRLGPAGTAVGVDERGVGVDAGDLAVDVGDLVRPGKDPAVEGGGDARPDGRQAAAEVGERLDPQALDLARLGRRDLDIGDVIATVDRAVVALAARLDPFDRPPADQLAREHDQRHVRVAEDLGAEGAADVRADAPDLVLRDAGHERGQQQPLDVRRLAGHPDRVLVGARVVPADVAPDLHRVGDEPLVDEPLADGDLGIGEGGIRTRLVAHVPLEHDVVGRVLVELRRAGLGRLLGIDHGRQRLPVEPDAGCSSEAYAEPALSSGRGRRTCVSSSSWRRLVTNAPSQKSAARTSRVPLLDWSTSSASSAISAAGRSLAGSAWASAAADGPPVAHLDIADGRQRVAEHAVVDRR